MNEITSLTFIDCPADLKDLKPGPKDLKTAIGPPITLIDKAEHLRRTKFALSLDLPSLAELNDKYLGDTIEVCGSGPSLIDSLNYLGTTKNPILALNGCHDFLISCGIKPTFAMMLDPHDWCAGYQTPTVGVQYFMGSSVHSLVWQRFREAGIKPYVFIPILTENEYEDTLAKYETYDFPQDQSVSYVAGETTVGLRAINAMMGLGFLTENLHGFDSCYAPGNDGKKTTALYAHRKHYTHHDARGVTLASKKTGVKFDCITNNSMARQIVGFASKVDGLSNVMVNGRLGLVRLVLHGDGALPWMAWVDGGPEAYIEHAHPEKMQAKYGNWAHWDYSKDKAI